MYHLPYFKEQNPEVVKQFIRQHPFAMLIVCNQNRPVATQVPLLLEEENNRMLLKGHIMKNTDHHKAMLQNNKVLCVFTGPSTYVSARWYTQPQTASTWNYMSVHARGTLSFTDEAGLRMILEKTTAHFEQDPASPASFQHLPEEYVDKLVQSIAGFSIEIETIENVFKLSQNRDAASFENIIQQLRKGNEAAQCIAWEMEIRKAQLFK
ncbi:MAG: FMN-binding negative transcriptional regulator [Flavisolibacter sp.]|nr:FMN-binding negative transcriptional regulator [Flavisolibacter sp.]